MAWIFMVRMEGAETPTIGPRHSRGKPGWQRPGSGATAGEAAGIARMHARTRNLRATAGVRVSP